MLIFERAASVPSFFFIFNEQKNVLNFSKVKAKKKRKNGFAEKNQQM